MNFLLDWHQIFQRFYFISIVEYLLLELFHLILFLCFDCIIFYNIFWIYILLALQVKQNLILLLGHLYILFSILWVLILKWIKFMLIRLLNIFFLNCLETYHIFADFHIFVFQFLKRLNTFLYLDFNFLNFLGLRFNDLLSFVDSHMTLKNNFINKDTK